MKKISVIIPTLNSSKTIKKTLDSLKYQNYKNFEIIILDSFSIDGTINIINSYKFKNIKIFRISKQKTLAQIRYFGILKSTGSYIAFLDSDDQWKFNKLYQQNIFLRNLKFISTGYEFKKNNIKKVFINFPNFISYDYLLSNRPIANSSVLIEKKLIQKIVKDHLIIHYAEDYLWWIMIVKKIKIMFFLKKNLVTLNILNTSRTSLNLVKNIKSLYSIYRVKLKLNHFKIVTIFYHLFRNNYKKKKFFYYGK